MGSWFGIVDASGSDSVSNRAHLKWLVRRIADEACKRIDDPKNTAKGNGWREMSWVKLERLAWQEEEEFYQATVLGDGDKIWEAADKLVIDAMRVDKASGKDKPITNDLNAFGMPPPSKEYEERSVDYWGPGKES